MIDMIGNNYRIRQVLLDGVFVGVIGPKKSGKSSFVKRLTGKRTGANARNETRSLAVYPVPGCDWTLVDYPHLESNNINYKFQFYFSKLFLDYVFLVYDSRTIGSSLTDSFDDFLVEVRKKHRDRFTLVFTKIDELLDVDDDQDDQDDLVETSYEAARELIMFLNERHEIEKLWPLRENIIWTCLIEEGANKLERYGVMACKGNLKILLRESFKREILGCILKALEKIYK